MKTVDKLSEKQAGDEAIVPNERAASLIRHFGLFSFLDAKSFYILDVRRKQICYVKADDLLFGGFSAEDSLIPECDFFSKVIHPEDLPLCADTGKAIAQYLKDFEEKRDEIAYFFCTFRLPHTPSFFPSSTSPQIVSQRMVPFWEGDELTYLLCAVERSTCREVRKLRLHYKSGLVYEEYNFATKRWIQQTMKSLTECEMAILLLAKHGRKSGEIANDLCKAKNTVRKQAKGLFFKLSVHSMQEVIEFVRNHRMLRF